MGKGCKVLLIVGIILLAILIVGGTILYSQRDKIKSVAATQAMATIEKDFLANLPEGFDTDEVKSTLKELKDKVQNLIAEKKVDLSKMAPMITELGEAMKDKKITTDEATKLIETIKTYIAKS